MKITIQFLAISLLILPVPVLLHLFPLIVPDYLAELNVFLILGAVGNSSVNAIIYLIYNDDIRNGAKSMLGMKIQQQSTARSGKKQMTTVGGAATEMKSMNRNKHGFSEEKDADGSSTNLRLSSQGWSDGSVGRPGWSAAAKR